jgi:hypothetical protein
LLQELSAEEKAALELKVDTFDRTKSGRVLVTTHKNPLSDGDDWDQPQVTTSEAESD